MKGYVYALFTDQTFGDKLTRVCYIGSTRHSDPMTRALQHWNGRHDKQYKCRSKLIFMHCNNPQRDARFAIIEKVRGSYSKLLQREEHYIAKYRCVNRYVRYPDQRKLSSEVQTPPPILYELDFASAIAKLSSHSTAFGLSEDKDDDDDDATSSEALSIS